MKRLLILIVLLICSSGAYAQKQDQYVGPVKEWTSSFTSIDVDAHIKLTLVPISVDNAPYIIYDTKGDSSSNFSASVERGGVLKIREKYNSKRVGITEVEVHFNNVTDINIARAETLVNGVINTKMLDINISDGAKFVADLRLVDLNISVTDDCCVELSGTSQYQTADISSSQYSASGLRTQATVIKSRHNAEARIYAESRLEAKTTTGGVVMYKTEPEVLRTEKTLFGGEISTLK